MGSCIVLNFSAGSFSKCTNRDKGTAVCNVRSYVSGFGLAISNESGVANDEGYGFLLGRSLFSTEVYGSYAGEVNNIRIVAILIGICNTVFGDSSFMS